MAFQFARTALALLEERSNHQNELSKLLPVLRTIAEGEQQVRRGVGAPSVLPQTGPASPSELWRSRRSSNGSKSMTVQQGGQGG
jgi:hypothetical protein